MPDEVRHDPDAGRYELMIDGGTVYATYRRVGDTLVVTHTVTPPALRGRGLASRLVGGMLADARRLGLRIVPQCWFVADYFDRHPEVRDLLADTSAD